MEPSDGDLPMSRPFLGFWHEPFARSLRYDARVGSRLPIPTPLPRRIVELEHVGAAGGPGPPGRETAQGAQAVVNGWSASSSFNSMCARAPGASVTGPPPLRRHPDPTSVRRRISHAQSRDLRRGGAARRLGPMPSLIERERDGTPPERPERCRPVRAAAARRGLWRRAVQCSASVPG